MATPGPPGPVYSNSPTPPTGFSFHDLPPPPGHPSYHAFTRPVGTSFLVHAGLSVGTWLIGVATDRVEIKDCLWPSGMVVNSWYQAVGIPVISYGLPVQTVLQELPWRQKLLLAGVTTWGARLFYYISKRAYERGYDDPRYTSDKLQPSFWPKALFTQFLPEALFQALITIPFTAPFRDGFAHGYSRPWGWLDSVAIGLFSAGIALEVLADRQLQKVKRRGGTGGGLMREGVWSIVRHPNYLGDALVHLSFPLLLFSSSTFHPLFFLGPLANYAFLRFVGGDKGTEEYQQERYSETGDFVKLESLSEYRSEKNSFWPDLRREWKNKWVWAVATIGALGVGVEKIVRSAVDPGVL